MDEGTRRAYAEKAKGFSNEWLKQPAPEDMYALLQKFFIPGSCADIGCGNGRDANWLKSQGFRVTAFDASAELLAQARELYPGITFLPAKLPSLAEISER